MLDIDNREGSKWLVSYMEKRGVPANLTYLPYGDAALVGNGPEGVGTVPIGIELKTLGDALECMTGGRFVGHQLPGLVKSYEVVFLIVEGNFRPDPKTGQLTELRNTKGGKRFYVPVRNWRYADFEAWLLTLQMQAGIHVRVTRERSGTASMVEAIYRWWSKPWEKHKSLNVLDDGKWVRPTRRQRLEFDQPTLALKVFNQMEGISYTRAAELAKKFKTVEQITLAGPDDFRVKGIGKPTAKRIYESLRSEE